MRILLIISVAAITVSLLATQLIIHKRDGTTIAVDVEQIDKITFRESLGWIRESVEAPNTQQVIFYSEAVGDSVSFHIFLPDEYQTVPTENFPVLYWLHGSGVGIVGIPIMVNYFYTAMQNNHIPPIPSF